MDKNQPENKPEKTPQRNLLSDIERLQLQEKMRAKATAEMVNHTIREWTMVRSLAWSERMIAIAAVILFWQDKEKDLWSFSGVGFVFFSLLFLGPICGIFISMSLLGIYKILKQLKMYPKSSKEFRRVIYPVFAAWFPFMYWVGHKGMEFYYDLIKAVPVWDEVKKMWFK